MLEEVLAEALDIAGLALGDLDALAVTAGPGSFSGIRTGLAAARGLALVSGLRVFGITTFAALAAPLLQPRLDERPIAAVIDARRGQVYLQLFSADGTPLTMPEALAPEAAAARLPARARLIGNGSPLLGPFLTYFSGIHEVEAQLDAAAVALAAAQAASQGVRPVEGTALEPFYLRDADAKPDAGRALLPVEG
jgi:tRNA threonylcarbamoyladenosine biosynthesis protein TsaB